MSYIVTKTDGTVLTTIVDGTKDDLSSSLVLLGRNFSNYGQYVANDFVRLLENFSWESPPSFPLAGQIWWKRDTNTLNVYTGTAWRSIASSTSSPNPPVTTISGDIWWDSNNQQLYVYNGTAPFNLTGWILVGPSYSAAFGKSGVIREVILDTLSNRHYVESIFIDGTRVGVISNDPGFTVAPYTIPDFTTIQNGINIRDVDGFWGTASNSTSLGGVSSALYFRKDTDNTTTGNLIISNDGGLRVGSVQQLRFELSGTTANITNYAVGGNMNFYVNNSGVATKALYITGSTGEVRVAIDPISTTGVTTKRYVDAKFVDSQLYGDPITTTQFPGDNSTKIATTAFVHEANVGVKRYIDAQVDTLSSTIALKAPLYSPTFSGNPQAPTPSFGDNSSSIATTEFVSASTNIVSDNSISGLALKANIASPTLTGIPRAPTASEGDQSTQIATTEYVVKYSGFIKNKIYASDDTFLEVSDSSGLTPASAVLELNGAVIFTASQTGMFLKDGSTAVTQEQSVNNTTIATTAYVRTATQKWDGSAKYVSTLAPDAGTGSDGDFWFQYTP